MKARAHRAGWLLLLGVLVASENRSRTNQLPVSPVQVASSDEVTLRVIVVDSADKAQRLIARLNSGEDFIALAHAESIDPTADAGGLIGKVTRSTLPAVLKDALLGLGPGQLSTVVQIPTGFAVLKVVDASDPSTINMNADAGARLATEGSVRYVIDVSGLVEAEALLQAFPKSADWNQDPRGICQVRRQSLAASERSLEAFLSPDQPSSRRSRSPFDVMQAQFALAQLHAYDGRLDRALEHYRQAYETARAGVPAAMLRMEEALGVAYLHKSGMENGVDRAPGDLFLFRPPFDDRSGRPRQSFAKTGDSDKAIAHFLSFLKQKPDDLEVRWLLNLAYLSIGAYPDKVPAAHLIPPSAFASKEDIGRFRDVPPQAGVNVIATARGAVVVYFA